MVEHIASTHHLLFTKKDLPSKTYHNHALHLEVYVQINKVKRVLIDGGVSLNIYTLQLVKNLGYSEALIKRTKGITIRAYDDNERDSEGTIKFPIQVNPIIAKTNAMFYNFTCLRTSF